MLSRACVPVLLPFLFLNHIAESESAAQLVLNAADFGLTELQEGEDATPVFRRAIEACHERGAAGLEVPAGLWHLFPDYAFEKTLAVANNNPGVKRVVFLLDGLEGFTLRGHGARLVCHGQMIPISADNAKDLTLAGFSINWARPFNFQGEVVATYPDKNAFDLKVHPDVVYEIRGSRLMFLEKPSRSPHAWREWAPPTAQHDGWEHNLQWNMWFDGVTRQPIPGEHQWALEPDPRVEEVEPGLIRLFNATHLMPQEGWVVAVKGMVDPNRTSPATRIARSRDVVMEDVTIHHAGGMGVIMQRTHNATLRRVRVALPEGTGRIVTTTADATHFNGCRGEILLEDCLFENMLDDATNIHGCYLRVEKQTGPTTLVCRLVHSQQLGLVVFEPGENARLVTSEDLQAYGDAKVVGVRKLNSEVSEITFDRLPEDGVQYPTCIYNTDWQPELTMRRCHVRNNRARIMLIATSSPVVVEDNVFEHCSMAGVQLEGDNGFWCESGPAADVVVRRNVFRNNAGAALRFFPQIDAARFPEALYHGGIVFEDNEIDTFHRLVVEGVAVDGLVFRRNNIRVSKALGGLNTKEPSFRIASGRNIVMERNTFVGEQPLLIHAGTESAMPELIDNQGIAAAP